MHIDGDALGRSVQGKRRRLAQNIAGGCPSIAAAEWPLPPAAGRRQRWTLGGILEIRSGDSQRLGSVEKAEVASSEDQVGILNQLS